jgi:hypothetical protein
MAFKHFLRSVSRSRIVSVKAAFLRSYGPHYVKKTPASWIGMMVFYSPNIAKLHSSENQIGFNGYKESESLHYLSQIILILLSRLLSFS